MNLQEECRLSCHNGSLKEEVQQQVIRYRTPEPRQTRSDDSTISIVLVLGVARISRRALQRFRSKAFRDLLNTT